MKYPYRPSFLRRMIPQKISIKLGLVLCALVLILLSLLGMSLTQITRDVLKVKVQDNLQEMAKRASREIELFVHRPLELLETSSQLMGRLHSQAWEQETILVEMSLNFPMFEEIVSTNLRGDEIASSNPQESKKNWNQHSAFQKAVIGKSFFSSVRIEEDYLPHVTISTPYYSLGEVKGVLIAKVNLRGMWEIVDGIRVGDTGRAFLISDQGILIAHPDKKRVLQNQNLGKEPALEKMINEKGKSAEYQLEQGPYYLASFASIQGPLPAHTIVQIERKEAYSLLDQMRILIWCMVLFSFCACVIVSFFLSRWLVKPVRSLQRWSRKVSLGDFDYYLSPKSSDEIGRLFINFRKMSHRLKAAREKEHLVAIGEAASMITHKLKNAIVSLKIFSQMIPERKRDQEFMDKFEVKFSSNVNYLENIFKNLSQVSSSREMKTEKVYLPELLERIGDSYQESFEQSNIEFDLRMKSDIPEILGDADQLREVFVNLIQNAAQSMSVQGGLLQVHGQRIFDESLIQIEVKDTGCGIEQEHLSKVFKPFFTTKSVGMGLGLAVCQKTIQAHHGHIQVSSVPNGGTTVIVTFPIAEKQKILIKQPSSKLS